MPKVLIGAAHTLENPGEVFGDFREADLTRKLLSLVLPVLDTHKIEYKAVPLDLPLMQRIDWINATGYSEENGDVFIELHINDGGKRGVEAWFKGSASADNKSQILAQTISENICKITGYTNQGAKSEYDHELGSLLILNQTNVIGTALETLYIDNEEDIKIIKDDKKFGELATAIADSIKKYLDNTPKTATLAPQNNIDVNKTPSPTTPYTPPTFQMPKIPASSPNSFGAPGAFGGSNFGGGTFGGGNKATLMDRDQRKEMINKVYKKILGKDPSQTDLNTYLNMGSTEEELTKKLLDSKDFTDMHTDAKDAKELRINIKKLESEIAELKSKVEDTSKLQKNLTDLLKHKNDLIKKLNGELVNRGIILKGQYIDVNTEIKAPVKTVSAKPMQKSSSKNMTQRLIDRFSKG